MKKAFILGLFLTLAVPFTSFAAFDTNLKYGSSGSSVKEMQEFLVDQGACSITPSGNFFALTLKCVKAFQAKEGISPVSGFWGPMTRAKASEKLDLSASDDDEKAQVGTVTAPDSSSDFQKLLATLVAIKASQDAQTNAVKEQAAAVQQTQVQLQQQIISSGIVQKQTPSAVYSIYITSPIVGPEGDRYHSFYAKVGVDNTFTVDLMKGLVTIDEYSLDTSNQNNVPTRVSGIITATNHVTGSVTNIYPVDAWQQGHFTINPTEAGDIPITFVDSKDNVTKDIIIHAQNYHE